MPDQFKEREYLEFSTDERTLSLRELGSMNYLYAQGVRFEVRDHVWGSNSDCDFYLTREAALEHYCRLAYRLSMPDDTATDIAPPHEMTYEDQQIQNQMCDVARVGTLGAVAERALWYGQRAVDDTPLPTCGTCGTYR